MTVSSKSIGRLSQYRRILGRLRAQEVKAIFSHDLAREAGGTAAQVRRDIMAVGYVGSSRHGYNIEDLIVSITTFLDNPKGERVALVGVGNLGRALLAYFDGRRPNLTIVAAFDSDPRKSGRVVQGCRCYSLAEMDTVIEREKIHIAIVAVPAPHAQKTADRLTQLGVTGLLNFAPVPLQVPGGVTVEDIDMTMALEKVAYFARSENN